MCGLWQQWTGTNLTAAPRHLLLPSSCVSSPTCRPFPDISNVSMFAHNTEICMKYLHVYLKYSIRPQIKPSSHFISSTSDSLLKLGDGFGFFLCRLMLSSLLHAFTIQATILLGGYCVAGRILGDLWISNEEFAAHFAEWVLWCLSVVFTDSRQFPV